MTYSSHEKIWFPAPLRAANGPTDLAHQTLTHTHARSRFLYGGYVPHHNHRWELSPFFSSSHQASLFPAFCFQCNLAVHTPSPNPTPHLLPRIPWSVLQMFQPPGVTRALASGVPTPNRGLVLYFLLVADNENIVKQTEDQLRDCTQSCCHCSNSTVSLFYLTLCVEDIIEI